MQMVFKAVSFAVATILVLPISLGSLAMEHANAQSRVSASDRMLAPGQRELALASRAGIWDVTLTAWSAPGASPTETKGLVAHREMIGPMLFERLQPGPGPKEHWTRIDELLFSKIDGRWDYVSMDSRAPVGLMPAFSLDPDPADKIFLSFIPFITPGDGAQVTGQMLRMEQRISVADADHEVKDQYFTLSDGVAQKWLAKRYSYTRRK